MAILGYNTQGGTADYWTNYITLCRFTPTENGTITGINFIGFKDFGGTANVRFAVYSDNAGVPNQLLAYTNTNTLVGTTLQSYGGTSFTEQVVGGLNITSGVPVWLALMNDDPSTIRAYYDAGDAGQTYLASPSFTTWNWQTTITSAQNIAAVKLSIYADYTPSAPSDAIQEGFRFRNDDGSETTATWLAAQDANAYKPLNQNVRLRMLIDSTGDLPSALVRLYYKRTIDGAYSPVPTVASVPEAFGTVTFGAIGTGANGGTSVAPSYPAGITAGQYLTLHVSSGGASNPTPSTPDGWALLATGTSTDGTYGLDTGPRRMTVFGKIADGTETGTLTVTITGGDSCRGSICRWTKSGSGSWIVDAQGADDSTSGTGVSMTFGSLNWNTGDATVVSVSQRVDSATQSAQSLTATGVTFGTRTNRATTAVTTGNDHRHVIDTFAAASSTSNVNAAATWSYTASAAASAGGVIVRLREYTSAVTNPVYISASSNITAGGEATTAQLTPPSGKSTSDFTTGRMWDNENGSDSLDLAADDYTELEWCLQFQSPAANGEIYQFRVYDNTTPLDTYSLTPELTIGSAPGGDTTKGFFGFF